MMRSLLMILITIILFHFAKAQANSVIEKVYPEVGKQMPYFVLHNLVDYTKTQVTMKDFKGKWLILDFWNKQCANCIANFPHVNAMQEQFKEKVQFLLVGIEDKENQIRGRYKIYKTKMNLNLPCAFDSLLANQFDIYATPVSIIIDPDGIVRGISGFLKQQQITDFLSGKTPPLNRVYREQNDFTYDDQFPLLVNKNGGDDTTFVYRSLLAPWRQGMPYGGPSKVEIRNGRFEVLREAMSQLYKLAYLGKYSINDLRDSQNRKYYPTLVLEIRDSSLFQPDLATGNGFYDYSLTLPKSRQTREFTMDCMQRDLKICFGFDVAIEIRKMPIWKLVATEDAKNRLKTKGGTTWSQKDNYSYVGKNVPLYYIIRSGPDGSSAPLVDETGINSNVDITLKYKNGFATSDDLLDALRQNGLSIEKGEEEYVVLVIRDHKP